MCGTLSVNLCVYVCVYVCVRVSQCDVIKMAMLSHVFMETIKPAKHTLPPPLTSGSITGSCFSHFLREAAVEVSETCDDAVQGKGHCLYTTLQIYIIVEYVLYA